ncbi:hypothetical protein [Protofrankia symbiont of Coriaria ruscifolia]|uniref:hypothetical protein n=1 Tax=Protofrankia symbiont of Coriaria ruscifolia TaxID=1306542 RepID=UPI001F5EB1B7|nr:hypothetical protein [Protofrankia symbiont of Coriaria ruscifolia]
MLVHRVHHVCHHETLVRPAMGRAGWATRAGLREASSWADAILHAVDRPASGPVEQVKTWNLAGLFRVPTPRGPVWLKTTPPFAANEAAVIATFAQVDPRLVPTVVAADPIGHLTTPATLHRPSAPPCAAPRPSALGRPRAGHRRTPPAAGPR